MRSVRTALLIPSLAAAFACGGPIDEASDAPVPVSVDTTAAGLEPTTWTALPGVSAATSPAVASANGLFHVVAVSNGGGLYHASTRTLDDEYSAWTYVGRPYYGLDANTAPVLLVEGSTLYAFARSNDGNLYRATKGPSTSWSSWVALTNTGRVRGRISVAFSHRTAWFYYRPWQILVTHVGYVAPNGTSEYLRLENTTLISSNVFSGAADVTLGSNGASEVWAAVHKTSQVLFYRAVSTSSGWSWSYVASRSALWGRVYDVSDLTWYAGAFHILYSTKSLHFPDYNTTYQLLHTRLIPGAGDDYFIRTITTFSPYQDPDAAGDTAAGRLFPEGALVVYRNKLVAGYRMQTGSIRYARWDNADPQLPWLGNRNVGGGYSRRRPALAHFDGRPAVSDYEADNYGNDILSASIGYSLNTIHVVDFTRVIYKQDVAAEINMFTSNSDGLDPVCVPQSDPNAPTPVAIADEDRAVLSEVGFNLWMLPNWFVNGLYRSVAQYFCEDPDSGWAEAGRTPAPCYTARLPVIVKSDEDIGYCIGTWIGRENDAYRVWEELGHYVGEAMGLGNGPTADHAALTGFPLSTLQQAQSLFSEGVNGCSGTTRCTGFTGIADNYDVNSTQHSFIYVVYYYLKDGVSLRSWVQEDLNGGSDLLQRKYDWVRDNIFHGQEFGVDGAPLNTL